LKIWAGYLIRQFQKHLIAPREEDIEKAEDESESESNNQYDDGKTNSLLSSRPAHTMKLTDCVAKVFWKVQFLNFKV
jgi:hypothetical protein